MPPAVQGARVRFYRGGVLYNTQFTNSSGEVSITVPLGYYTIAVDKEGYVETEYLFQFVKSSGHIIVNLPSTPQEMAIGVTHPGNWILNPTVSKNPATQFTHTLTPTVSKTPAVTPALVLAPSVVKSPTTWRLCILPCFVDHSQEPFGTIDPGEGVVDSGAGVTVPTSATTRQFTLFKCCYLDGAVVNDNSSATHELLDTVHNYTVPAQNLGTPHRFAYVFRSAWELVVSTVGDGTTNHTGTFEVLNGQSIAVSATPGEGKSFLYWTLDGLVVGTDNSFTVIAQVNLSTHLLVAHFTP